MTKISIIIPHFNRSDIISKAIASVESQTYKDWELIIIDDISDPNEWESLQNLASEKIKIYQRSNLNKGPSSCRNYGVSVSTAPYIIFLDSDDELAPHCLEQRISAMEADKALLAGVFLSHIFHETPGDSMRIFNQKINLDLCIGKFLENENPWQTMAPIWRKSFFLSLQGFDEKFIFMEDPDLHLRALYSGIEKIKLFYDFPPDSYYRLNHMDNTKDGFYEKSILYRILFYSKLFSGCYSHEFIITHTQSIKKGIYKLIKYFLYSRQREYYNLYTSLLQLITTSKLFSKMQLEKLRFLISVGNTENKTLKLLKVKGICYRLLPE